MFILQRIKRVIDGKLATINPAPIIILGHQKSGTSAIAALLAKATGKTLTLDFFYKNNQSRPFFRAKLHDGRLPLNRFLRSNSQYLSADIIKEPELTYFYDRLTSTFPSATYIFVVREPKATIKSVLDRLSLPGDQPSLTAQQYQQTNPLSGWLPAIEGKAPNVAGENYIERLAHRWNLVASTYLDHQNQMVLIRYEDFLSDKLQAIQTLANKINLPVVNDISDQLDNQFQPRGKHHLALSDFFSHQNQATIDRICSANATQFNYCSVSECPVS